MSFRQQYKVKTFGFGDTDKGRFIRTKKHEETRKTQRAATFNKNRVISNSAESISQSKVVEDRMTKLLKWKVERERRRTLEQLKKKPPFVVGVVHHKLCSPIRKDHSADSIMTCEKTRNQATHTPLSSFNERVTKATEERLMNKTLTKKITKDSLRNPSVTNKEEKCQKMDVQAYTPANCKFKTPTGLVQVPLFCTVAITSMSPAKINELISSPSRISRANRKTGTAEFNVEPVINMEGDISTNDKKSDTDYAESSSLIKGAFYDEEKIFNSSNNNRGNNDNEIKFSDDNTIHNSKEYNKEVYNSDKEVFSSSNNNISMSLKSDSPNEPVFFSPYIVSSRGKSNARKEQQLKRGFSLGHSPSTDVPTKDTVMKNLNISVEEEAHTAQYFQFLLNREITRLNELCKKWTEIKAKPETTEDGKYEISQTIGQTNLLISKKFERFCGLVADCETGKGEMLVTCKDLQGFWDMMYIEVKKCDSQFEKLETLCSQGWKKEELPVGKSIAKKKSTVKRNVFTKSSSIKAFLAKKKQRMSREIKHNRDMKEVEVTNNQILSNKYGKDESFYVKYKTRKSMSSTPNQKDYAPMKDDKRLSPLQKVRFSETFKKIKSPLIRMEVSEECETPEVHLDDTISYVNSDQTPGKSILKPSKNGSVAESHMKSTNKVNFDDHIVLNEVPIDEETQTKMDLAAALSRIDSFNFDNHELQKHVSISNKQEIMKQDESIRVLRNRTVTAIGTPIAKRKALKEMSTAIQESEHKENKPLSGRRRKSFIQGSINEENKMNLHSLIDNTSLEESNVRRRSTRNVKFLGMDIMDGQ
ncbi:Disks large-associated protein 5 [Habropoda laboriosa]|uniref:Disks large-associated protein 5 n=1 Tax=Habropoda laboriosa TaxID=597456 RepID=A0A0L7QKE5_9HYME|nr:Disks large-associated protein 5 [Habropoda laboriosa]